MHVRHLSEEFIKQSKETLLKKQEELTKEINNLHQRDPYLREGRDDENSEAVEEAISEDLQKEIIDAQIKTLNESLDQVEKALAKIDEDTYGICENTGKPIDIARLRAYPEATTIVE